MHNVVSQTKDVHVHHAKDYPNVWFKLRADGSFGKLKVDAWRSHSLDMQVLSDVQEI